MSAYDHDPRDEPYDRRRAGGRGCRLASSSPDEESRAVQRLDGHGGGRWWVTTRSGTRHLVDLDAGTVTRYGAAGREWTREGVGFGPVTPDGEPFRFSVPPTARVGECMYLTNADEWRLTSTVVSIEPADTEEHATRVGH